MASPAATGLARRCEASVLPERAQAAIRTARPPYRTAITGPGLRYGLAAQIQIDHAPLTDHGRAGKA